MLHFWYIGIKFPFYLEKAGRKSSPSAGNEDNVENKESQLASDSPNGNKDECSENEKVMYLNSSLVFCSIYDRIPFSKYCPYGIKPQSINQ